MRASFLSLEFRGEGAAFLGGADGGVMCSRVRKQEKKGMNGEKRGRQKNEVGRMSDDNYPLDFCPTPAVNQLMPLGEEQPFHWPR